MRPCEEHSVHDGRALHTERTGTLPLRGMQERRPAYPASSPPSVERMSHDEGVAEGSGGAKRLTLPRRSSMQPNGPPACPWRPSAAQSGCGSDRERGDPIMTPCRRASSTAATGRLRDLSNSRRGGKSGAAGVQLPLKAVDPAGRPEGGRGDTFIPSEWASCPGPFL